MSIPEKERNKEILTCIKVNEGENPELCYMSEKNKPEYLSPDYEGEQINNLNENVVSLNIFVPPSDSLFTTQVILKQWESDNDAALRLPSKKGKGNIAKIVGFNAPYQSDEFPGQKMLKIFITWDRKLHFDDLQED